MGLYPASLFVGEIRDGGLEQRREPLSRFQSPGVCGRLASPGMLDPGTFMY